jgi:adenine-specific DNA-methyltransferase
MNKRENLGQVFTHPKTVDFMLSLRKNHVNTSTLEPAAGNGAFSNKLPGCAAIEIDPDICPKEALAIDFFTYPSFKFLTQIANPPYVAGKNILLDTRMIIERSGGTLLNHGKTNLYLYFLEKMAREHMQRPGSEIIIIIPRDFLKATSAILLNKWLYAHGTITHYYDHGDRKMFKDAFPNTCIIRYELGDYSRKTITNDGVKNFVEIDGQLLFLKDDYSVPLSNLFTVKVGGVSGADEIFADNVLGNEEFVFSETRTTGKTRKMIYNYSPAIPYLEFFYKEDLLKRKIKHFTEDNWWQWGRDFHHSTDKRIYVNCKTRQANPFFTHPCTNYDGSILALFLKDQSQDPKALCNALNKVNWKDLGFVCGNRYLFSQRTLERIILPSSLFIEYAKKIYSQ